MQRKNRFPVAFHLLFFKKIIRLYLPKNLTKNVKILVKFLIDFTTSSNIIQLENFICKNYPNQIMTIHKLPDYVINRLKA